MNESSFLFCFSLAPRPDFVQFSWHNHLAFLMSRREKMSNLRERYLELTPCEKRDFYEKKIPREDQGSTSFFFYDA
jgi:hypothetical protein